MASNIGRQRFDFTDGSVVIEQNAVSAGTTSPSGSGGEQLVRIVADQWRELMDAISKAGGTSIANTVVIQSNQFSSLINAFKNIRITVNGGGSNNNAQFVYPIELDKSQFDAIIQAIKGSRPRTSSDTDSERRGAGPRASGFWDNIIDTFRKGYLVTNRRGIGKRSRLYARRFGNRLKQFGSRVSANSAIPFNKAIGGMSSLAGGAIAKFAGPIGIAVSAVSAAFDALNSAMQATIAGVKELGNAAIKVAKNDGIGLLASGFQGVANGLSRIPIVGGLLASSFELVSASLTTFKSVLDAFTARGRELSRYNPVIAMAAATADVRKLFADMREANQNASKYADLILKSQQLDESFQRALQPLKEAVMKLLIKVAPAVEGMAVGLGRLIEQLPIEIQFFSDAMYSLSGALINYQKAMQELEEKRLREKQAENMKNEGIAKLFPDMLRQAMESVQLEPDAPKQGGPNKDALRFPLFQM